MADKQYLVLARKWRPQLFDDVVGQEHITRTLKNAIVAGRVHHAFLFIGSRGIGKTTTARILAKALNCLSFDKPTVTPCGVCANCRSISEGNNIDVIEIDGASNNGVEDVREIRDNIRMVPTNGRYKIYIIDEVHQLSAAAFNALLKTLEEPPPHALFVLATTEAHKIPATIISRCQRYDFRRVDAQHIVDLLRRILEREGLRATEDALHAIARVAEGGVRDAESILDELITYCEGEITSRDVSDVLGLVDWNVLHTLCDAVLAKDVGRLLTLVEEVVSSGKDLSQFVEEILRYFRNLLVCKTADAGAMLHYPEEELHALKTRAAQVTLTNLIRLVEQFASLTGTFDSQLAQRIALESLLIRISKAGVEISVDTVLEKLLALGQGGMTLPGTPARAPTPPDPPEAGPVRAAPPVPATQGRATLTDGNLERQWAAIAAHATQASLNLGVWIAQGKPAGVEGDTVVLEFPAEQAQAREIVEKAEYRGALEASLAALTENARTFRTVLREAEQGPAPAAGVKNGASVPFYPSVNPEEARTALEEPHIAEVLEVFKGRIAEIRHAPSPASVEDA